MAVLEVAMADGKNIYQRLLAVQGEAVAPRSVDGKFGKTRSAELILEAYKPICRTHGLYLFTTDEVKHVEGRNYVQSTATVVNVDKPDETHSASAWAWENEVELNKYGSPIMDTSQVSGKTGSYAKKYALQNLFAVDDSKDADNDHDYKPADPKRQAPAPSVEPSAPAVDSDAEALKRAKAAINEELEKQGYKLKMQKTAFVYKVIRKQMVETLDDADAVMDQLENEGGEQ